MINWILTSSVLIVVILLIRKLLGEKLSPGAQYVLWILVLLRLLVPVSFGKSSYSLAALADQAVAWVEEQTADEEVESYIYGGGIVPEEIEDIKLSPPDAAEKITDHVYVPSDGKYSAESASFGKLMFLYLVWFTGMAVTAGIFFLSNLIFRVRIYSDRKEIEEEELEKEGLSSKVPVYVSRFVTTPCLAGLRMSAVYIPRRIWEQAAENKTDGRRKNRELDAMICHENVHFVHGDQFWGFLRLLCLIIHWYNPFVWMAALASRQDAELFCDAGTIKKLGEENRYDYGRILLGMVTQEEGSFRMLPDSLRHAGLCNTEMADTKKHMERRIRKLTAMPKKSMIIVTFTLLLGLMAFSYVFIGKEEQDSLFWELSSRNHTEQGEVMITQSDLPDGKVSDEVLSYVENMAEVSIPKEEEVEEVRKKALAGMKQEEIDMLTAYVKDYHNWLEYRLLYERWENRLSDRNNVVWNFIDQTGTVQAGWYLEDDPGDYIDAGEEERKKIQEKYPEFGKVTLEELERKYGEPYYEESYYGAETVIQRMRELTARAENKAFQADVENLCNALQQAKDTHEANYVMQAHEILHDMEYFLLRYSPKDVMPYTQDKSLSGRYYDVLEVWAAWREGRL